ncbi:hypothetical protein BJ138DRAFT_1119165 [Hygrophoropsis aurantiaca]|uniref:Uncharacterized protein n=1 Tax=Hygrophoropsis aurantiaca TaxID=72124 RepID=A0ACB7ZUH8_9AGAM|nr:hypothetical protein BJ138DRAFT_1119165 [Hygrophoropsis aurantiaca]
MSLEEAERTLNKSNICRTAFQKFPKATLVNLCEANGIQPECNGRKYQGSSLKRDYEKALYEFRKRTGRHLGKPPNEREIIVAPLSLPGPIVVHPQPTCPPTSKVTFRVYNKPGDWVHTGENSCPLEENGDLDLTSISRIMQTDDVCRIIDPTNHRMFYQYEPGILRADDLEDLMDNGFLQVTFARCSRYLN